MVWPLSDRRNNSIKNKMKRRKAIASILGVLGGSLVPVMGVKYFIDTSSNTNGALRAHIALIAELVDVIIPPTESPGAKESLVHEYIINYMEACASKKERTNFFNGLMDLQEESRLRFKNSFENCSMSQKIQLTKEVENRAAYKGLLLKINNKLRGRSFFNILKSLTIEGYCTSSNGATIHLEYMPIPGKYNAITNLSDYQKAWATK